MSDQNPPRFIIATESEENSSQKSPTGSFILASPSNSALRNQSPTLKKTKYDKLLKLYNDVIDNKTELSGKVEQLESRKNIYNQMQQRINSKTSGDAQGKKKLEQLTQLFEQKRKQHLAEISSGDVRLKEALKQIMELDSQIIKSNQKSVDAHAEKKNCYLNQITKSNSALENINSETQAFMTSISQLESQLSQNKQKQSDLKNGGFILGSANLDKEKADLEMSIAKSRTEISTLKQRIEEQKNMQVPKSAEEEKAVKAAKDELKSLQEQQNDLRRKVKQTKDKINKESKAQKSIPVLQKNIEQSQERLKKVQKQQKQKTANLQKLKQQSKQKYVEVPAEYRELKVSNEKLQAEVDRLEENYKLEIKRQNTTLVPPNVIQHYNQKIEMEKQSYEENKNLPQKMKKLQQEIKELREEKDSLEWDVNPVMKNNENAQKREVERIHDLQEQIKKLQRQSAQVSSRLEEYSKAYPDFEFEKKKSKKVAAPAPVPVKKEQKAEEPKKKKKGKNDKPAEAQKQAEPEVKVEPVKVEPVKVEPVAVKEEEKTKPKGKKNKKK